MSEMCWYKVPYTCNCEACGAQMSGVIKRGPQLIETETSFLTSRMQAVANIAELNYAKKNVESNLEQRNGVGYMADATCPECGHMQSWSPVHKPRMKSYAGLYTFCLSVFLILALLIWLIFFLDTDLSTVFFFVLMTIGLTIGILIPVRVKKKNRERDKQKYEEDETLYKSFREGLAKVKVRNKPEVDWNRAEFVPTRYDVSD
ncbi:MAG: hypothetical protein K6F26_06630 [Lachnospiraceae bacterium]|nr:hypothetical protein [Lachnospiraceae bacterium]